MPRFPPWPANASSESSSEKANSARDDANLFVESDDGREGNATPGARLQNYRAFLRFAAAEMEEEGRQRWDSEDEEGEQEGLEDGPQEGRFKSSKISGISAVISMGRNNIERALKERFKSFGAGDGHFRALMIAQDKAHRRSPQLMLARRQERSPGKRSK